MTSSSPPQRSDRGDRHRVAIESTDITFSVDPGQPLLEAARDAGAWLPFECGWGSCGTCKVTLVEGEVELLFPGAPAVLERDARRRRIVACQSAPLTDLVIKVAGLSASAPEERPTARYRATLAGRDRIGPGVRRFVLQLDRETRFREGQCAILHLPGGVKRCYSMANLSGGREIELVTKRLDGPGSQALHDLPVGARLDIDLPFGDMWLRPSERPVVLVAGGVGVSALLGLLHRLSRDGDTRPVIVVYGANTLAELVCWEEVQALTATLPEVVLVPTLVTPPDHWNGGTGFVTDSLGGLDHTALEANYYVAGPPLMVDAVRDLLDSRGVRADHIHYDRFG